MSFFVTFKVNTTFNNSKATEEVISNFWSKFKKKHCFTVNLYGNAKCHTAAKTEHIKQIYTRIMFLTVQLLSFSGMCSKHQRIHQSRIPAKNDNNKSTG